MNTFQFRNTLMMLLLLMIAACSGTPERARETTPDMMAMLKRIHAAGARDQSAITVAPLRSPGNEALENAAREDMRSNRLGEAAAKLQQALVEEPDSPPLLQLQAELDVRHQHWRDAEQHALDSWKHGPKLGPLCARNWQTVIEVRRLRDDAAGITTAQHWLARCHVEPVHRY